MIVSVARAFKWSPETLSLLYLDYKPFDGLGFWYNDAVIQEKEIEKAAKIKK